MLGFPMEDVPGSEDSIYHSNDLTPLGSISKVNDLPDGSSIFEISDNEEDSEEDGKEDKDFYSNLASELESTKLNNLAIRLLDEIKDDEDSRQEWTNLNEKVLNYLGFKIDDFSKRPFVEACSAFDSTLASALIEACSTIRAELFPAGGPVKSEIIGSPTEQSEDEGERVKLFMNYYLTQMDKDYYPDSEKLIFNTVFFGSCFRKVYQDPLLKRPVSRTVVANDFIIDHNTTSILSSSRMTQRLFLSRKDVILREREGDFIKVSLPLVNDSDGEDESGIKKAFDKLEGVSKSSSENKNLFTFYETHVDLLASEVEDVSDEDDNLPRPYIVTICDSNKKIVSIRRNWEEDDDRFEKKEYFIHYYYLKGGGLYGLGLAQLMGSNAIALTSILRQLIDAGTLKNFPGGIKQKGLIKSENNDRAIGPGEFKDVETGDRPIGECLMLMPYAEPSSALMQLRNELIQQTSSISAAANAKIPEIGANAPVGTTLMMLEVANKAQSSVLRSFHVSLCSEFKLMFNLFGKHLKDKPYPFAVPGRNSAIMKKDFNDRVNIVPVSDPNILTSAHRLIRAEQILKLAQSAPDLHDMREIYKLIYLAINVENVDRILPPKPEPPEPKCLDPKTENAMFMVEMPIAVSMFQNDDEHIVVHKTLLQDPNIQGNIKVISEIQMHIQAHKCYKALKEIIQNKQQEIQGSQMSMQQLHMRQRQIGYEASQSMMMGSPLVMSKLQEIQGQINQIQSHQQQLSGEINNLQNIGKDEIMAMPEIQNMVAARDAEETRNQIMQQEQQAEEDKKNSVDPSHVALADIEQRREASILKDEEAKLRVEAESFKSQLKFESDKAKIGSQEAIAVEKNQVDLAIAQMKQSPNQIF